MPIVTSKQKNGTLTFGTAPDLIDVSCQPTAVKITTEKNVEEGAETLCGEVEPDTVTYDSTLEFTAIQDWSDDAGLIAWSHLHAGEVHPFTWAPAGAGGPAYTGDVQVDPLDIGGDVAARLTSDAQWSIVGAVTPTYPVTAEAAA